MYHDITLEIHYHDTNVMIDVDQFNDSKYHVHNSAKFNGYLFYTVFT